MKVSNITILTNEETGKVEADATVNIYHLDGAEARDTALDLVNGVIGAVKGFHPETGAPV